MSTDIKSLGSFVWSIAELLRGGFKLSEYGKVILPFVVLRRLDCILEESKPAVLETAALSALQRARKILDGQGDAADDQNVLFVQENRNYWGRANLNPG